MVDGVAARTRHHLDVSSAVVDWPCRRHGLLVLQLDRPCARRRGLVYRRSRSGGAGAGSGGVVPTRIGYPRRGALRPSRNIRLGMLGATVMPMRPSSILLERRQTGAKSLPRGARVGRFEQAAAGSGEHAVLPRPLARLPQHSVNDVRVHRIEHDVDRAGVLVLVEDFLNVFPPSVDLKSPRSALGPYGWPSTAAYRRSGSRGSTAICGICCPSRRPRCVQEAPASVDL